MITKIKAAAGFSAIARVLLGSRPPGQGANFLREASQVLRAAAENAQPRYAPEPKAEAGSVRHREPARHPGQWPAAESHGDHNMSCEA
jgi:hypothetical protein